MTPAGRDLELDLAAIWARVLGLFAVGIDDNFFELGGDSLTIMQIRARIERRFEVDLTPTILFEHPTVRALAHPIRERSAESRTLTATRSNAIPARSKR